MKWKLAIQPFFYILIVAITSSSCANEPLHLHHYVAVKAKDTAVLHLLIEEKSFYGQLKITYSNGLIDSGEVSGQRLGDTLLGRFKYDLNKPSQKIKPFVLLKDNENYKQGTGYSYTYFNIPYFAPNSIRFEADEFYYRPFTDK